MKKFELIQLILEKYSISTDDLFSKYENRYFENNEYPKKLFFEDAVFNRVQKKNENYIIQKCQSLKHHMDRRNPLDYGLDLIYGWIIEDILETLLKNNGFDVLVTSADSKREFLTSNLIQSTSDFHVLKKGHKREVEILVDWKETWVRYNHLDLRDKKYLNLKINKAILLGVSPKSNSFLLIDLSKPNLPFQENYIKAYRKKGYSIMDVQKYLINFNEVILQLNKLLL